MLITDKGTYYELPLQGYRVTGFTFNPHTYLRLAREELVHSPDLMLNISMSFELVLFGQTQRLEPFDHQTWKRLIDLWGKTIRKAVAYKTGDLFISFEHNCELFVRDSPYESWIVHVESKKANLNSWIIGGVGRTSYFDYRI